MSSSRRTLLAGLAAGGAAAVAASSFPAHAARSSKATPKAGALRPNVLFISIDDLNDWVGILGGHPQARTPNIDRLAAMGVSFNNAHAAAPACNPSRTSVLTGRLPSTTGVYSNKAPFRSVLPDIRTLPQRFSDAGYTTMGAGKIFHQGDSSSWDRFWPDPCAWPMEQKRREAPKQLKGPGRGPSGGFNWGPGRADRENAYPDAKVARIISRQLKKEQKGPFFLACGFFRPHLNWFVPQDYFDRHPKSQVVLPEVLEGDLSDVPQAGKRMARLEEHQRIIELGIWKDAVQGYLAALEFADAQLGRVLDALEEGPHKANTVVVLWSDHGWSLGTKFHWKKHALWEECTRVPLVFRVPGKQKKGGVCERPVSLVDIFPTLTDLCGLPTPEKIDGRSLASLIAEPSAPWAGVALTTNGRGNHAVRDERYRYIRYEDGSEELYDHASDPNEWKNRSRDEALVSVKEKLRSKLPSRDAPAVADAPHECGAMKAED